MSKNVVVTGKLDSMKRADFEELINRCGWTLQASVAGNTEYLVTNYPNSGTSKNLKADKLGIKKITELEFIRILKESLNN